MIGACTNHHDPDMWFPETQLSVGRPSRKAHQDMMERAIEAMSICQTCPIRAKCLELGMMEDNIEHGIWGGMLAGDRIILARSRRSGTIREQALAFAEGVRAWQSIG